MSIYQKLLRQWTAKTYKSLTESPQFKKPFLIIKEIPYNLHNGLILNLLSAPTTYCGTSSILFRACQVWNKLPLSMKQIQSFFEQKQRKRCSEICTKLTREHPYRRAISKLFCNFIQITLPHGFFHCMKNEVFH